MVEYLLGIALASLFEATNVRSFVNYVNLENNNLKNNTINLRKQYIDEVYTPSGANKYTLYKYDDNYILENKVNGEVTKKWEQSFFPYESYDQKFLKIFAEKGDINEIAFNGKNFIDLNSDLIIEDENLRKIAELNFEAGDYVEIYNIPTSATKINNSFYFEKLRNKHGQNNDGTCFIVSTQILLGYYDTFVNDSLVLDTYDIPTKEEHSTNNIRSFNQSPGTDEFEVGAFHDYLYLFLKDNVWYDDPGNGLGTKAHIDFVNRYLMSRGFDGDNYVLNTCEGNLSDIFSGRNIDIIKNAIKENRPVITNGCGHSTVAFAYDSDFVYVHTGRGHIAKTWWETFDNGHESSTNFYDFGSIDIEFKSDVHKHSNNYINTQTNKSICPCGKVEEYSNLWLKRLF